MEGKKWKEGGRSEGRLIGREDGEGLHLDVCSFSLGGFMVKFTSKLGASMARRPKVLSEMAVLPKMGRKRQERESHPRAETRAQVLPFLHRGSASQA